jgi:serine protease SohB
MQIVVFAAQFLIVIFGIAALIILIAALAARSGAKSELEIERMDRKLRSLSLRVRDALLNPKDLKKELKNRKKDKKESHPPLRTFVLDFKGDMKASAVDSLREEISALLDDGKTSASDEVLVRVESPGGMVHGYGLAAAQLLRIKKAGLKLTICVDKVAASGGYMMACTADKIVAAPFAIVGSIGVVAQLPNFHRLLKKHDVDYKEYTAGEFKRTVSLLGEVTSKGEEKFKEQLEDTHVLFKQFVGENRPKLDVSKVATGEYWYGLQALNLGLVDEIRTSDEVIQEAAKNRLVLHVKFQKKQPFSEKFSGILGKAFQKAILGSIEDLDRRRFF